MLRQLIKPYYYSMDCIYWDFAEARWKHHYRSNNIEPVPNPNAYLENEDWNDFNDNGKTIYHEGLTYVVRTTDDDSFLNNNKGNKRYWLERNWDDAIKGNAKVLKAGQLVRFRRK